MIDAVMRACRGVAAGLLLVGCASGTPAGGDDPADARPSEPPPDAMTTLPPDAGPDRPSCTPDPGGEVCDGEDNDCDEMVDEGFSADTNPACSGNADLGAVDGDTGGQIVSTSGFGEAWYRVRLDEVSNDPVEVTATVRLTSPPGVDYDLFVYCHQCPGTPPANQSEIHGLGGHTDVVELHAGDDFGSDDTHVVIIEVRHVQSNRCADWQLEVEGNTLVSVGVTCDG